MHIELPVDTNYNHQPATVVVVTNSTRKSNWKLLQPVNG